MHYLLLHDSPCPSTPSLPVTSTARALAAANKRVVLQERAEDEAWDARLTSEAAQGLQPSLTSSAMGLLPNQGLSTAHSWPFLHPLSMLPQQYSQQQPLPQPLHFTQPPMQQQAPTAPPSQADQPPPWPTHLPTTAPLPFGAPAYRPMPPS